MATWGGVRGLAQAFMRSAAEAGIGAAKSIAILQESGLTYRRTDMLADYRQFAGISIQRDIFSSIGMDKRLNQSQYVMTKGYQKSPFRYQVGIIGYIKDTGQPYEANINVSSNVELTRRQAEEAGYDTAKGAGYIEEVEITDVYWYSATINEDASF